MEIFAFIAFACALAIFMGVLYILSEILNTLRKIKDAVEHTDYLATCEEARDRVDPNWRNSISVASKSE